MCRRNSYTKRKRNTRKSNKRTNKKALSEISQDDAKKIIIAYEPIWAIGTGKVATKEDANNMLKCIRKEIENLYSVDVAQNISLLYGGSVKKENAKELFSTSDIDGALIGGASLKVEEFNEIIKQM